MKPELILKSPADIPADALSFAVTLPARAASASKQDLGPAERTRRREIRDARRRSTEFARDVYARASTPFDNFTPWQRGGLNE